MASPWQPSGCKELRSGEFEVIFFNLTPICVDLLWTCVVTGKGSLQASGAAQPTTRSRLFVALTFFRYFLVDFYAPATAVESIMEHLSRDIDVIRPNVVKHPLTQEVKECEGIVPVPLEEKLYSTKKRK